MTGRRTPGEPAATGRDRRRQRLRRGAYLLPSLFTIANMLLGFYAVVSAFRGSQLAGVGLAGAGDGHFVRAALAVFAAAILDALDGRIARLTGTDSEFGKEYDSLADLFTFGATPALVTFLWGLHGYGRLGWLVPFYYLVCTATRLARFNVDVRVVDTRYFVGLPSPAAAGAVCSLLFYAPDHEWRDWWGAAMLLVLGIVGTLEVSTFRYRSFKDLDLRKRWSYRAALPLAAILLVIVLRPTAVFLVLALSFAVSGPLAWLFGRFRRRPAGGGTDGPRPADETGESARDERYGGIEGGPHELGEPLPAAPPTPEPPRTEERS